MRKSRLLLGVLVAAFVGVVSVQAQLYSDTPEIGYWDFGDDPDSYLTTLAVDGPRHYDGTLEWFGYATDPDGREDTPDYETDGHPSVLADGDDTTGTRPDDEDSVLLPGGPTPPFGPFPRAVLVPVTLNLAVSQWDSGRYGGGTNLLYIDGWIDWGADGSFADPEDHVLSGTDDPSTWGQNYASRGYAFAGWLPADTNLYSRWRVNYGEGNMGYSGPANYGEVEDHIVLDIVDDPRDGKAPEPTTLLLLPVALLAVWNQRLFKKRPRA